VGANGRGTGGLANSSAMALGAKSQPALCIQSKVHVAKCTRYSEKEHTSPRLQILQVHFVLWKNDTNNSGKQNALFRR